MVLSCETRGDLMILTVEKPRIDSQIAGVFRDEAEDYLSDNRVDCAVDLSNVRFMDSTGLSSLVSLLKFIGPDRKLELCGLTPQVTKALKLTRLDDIFVTRANVREAELAREARAAMS
ncbi:MAG: STAS domain-containing protein [Pseudomonadota bacterium]